MLANVANAVTGAGPITVNSPVTQAIVRPAEPSGLGAPSARRLVATDGPRTHMTAGEPTCTGETEWS